MTEGMGGTGQDMGWEGTGREGKGGRGGEREERATAYSPKLKFLAPPLHERRAPASHLIWTPIS